MTVPVDVAGAAALLRDVRRAVLVCHVSPDGDAIGSTAGLAGSLQSAGAEVRTTFDPGTVPGALTAIPGADRFEQVAEVDADGALVVVLDCGGPDRVGAASRLLDEAAQVLVIDHHSSNQGFGDLFLLQPDAPSTASIVTEILDAAGLPVDESVATALYAGLATDTGSFRWGGPAAHRTAARLLECGADAERMAFALLDSVDFSWLARGGEVQARARLDPGAAAGGGVVWLALDRQTLRGMSWAEAETLVSRLRGVREAVVSVLLKEVEPQVWNVSMRGRGVDVSAVAVGLGGGGHRAAAGCTLRGGLRDVEARVCEQIELVGAQIGRSGA